MTERELVVPWSSAKMYFIQKPFDRDYILPSHFGLLSSLGALDSDS